MYKLTILFFFLIAFNSQSLTDIYHLKFENKDAACTFQMKEGGLVFENNHPGVIIIEKNNASANTDSEPFGSTQEPQNASGKIYKISKGATWQEGLKIGETDEIDAFKEIGGTDDIDAFKEIGGSDEIDAFKEIGENDEIDAFKEIGGTDEIDAFKEIGENDEIDAFKEIGVLLGVGNHQACEIMLGYELLTVVEKSGEAKTAFPISEKGLYLIVSGDKFGLLR